MEKHEIEEPDLKEYDLEAMNLNLKRLTMSRVSYDFWILAIKCLYHAYYVDLPDNIYYKVAKAAAGAQVVFGSPTKHRTPTIIKINKSTYKVLKPSFVEIVNIAETMSKKNNEDINKTLYDILQLDSECSKTIKLYEDLIAINRPGSNMFTTAKSKKDKAKQYKFINNPYK